MPTLNTTVCNSQYYILYTPDMCCLPTYKTTTLHHHSHYHKGGGGYTTPHHHSHYRRAAGGVPTRQGTIGIMRLTACRMYFKRKGT